MKKYTLIIIVLVVLAVIAAVFAFGIERSPVAVAEPTTFEECAARYPAMESYPRQCMTPSGISFTEQVSLPEAPEPAEPTNVAGIPNLIEITSPTIGQKVSSPITFTGQARGTWYFEASFPVEVRDAQNRVIGTGHGEAQSEWMTENFVPFRGTVTYEPQTAGSAGFLVVHKDNPSGDPERDQSVRIPITF